MDLKYPWDLPDLQNTGGLSSYRYRFLAEGDSWFSIGEFPPWATSNLLFELLRVNLKNDVIINCARQGDTLSHIAKHFYGKAGKWPEIYDANRDQLDNPDRIKPGQVLKIPSLDDGTP